MASDAVELFFDRAVAREPSFRPDAAGAQDVATRCARPDGIPLAIELAAAQVGALTPAQITAHIGDRIEVLANGARSSPARHRSLTAALEWSHDLLSGMEQALLRRLPGSPDPPPDPRESTLRMIPRSLVRSL